MRRKFYLDRGNGMVMGVLAGIADYTGWNAKWLRIGAVAATLLGGFPWTLIAYGVAAWLAKPRPYGADLDRGYRLPRTSTYELNASMRDIDRRMAEVETHVVNSNDRLAREIEELR
ncbi:PspC domain-containing protein [Enterovirga sp. GCM10030262]|uniref:PspC domain-containing protein n=1 Tax=Enterovirga sp. GCM10030262 TaxID=3273391 RepID=UPI003613C595